MSLSRREFLSALAKGLSGITLLGLSYSGVFLKKGAPPQVLAKKLGEVKVGALSSIPEPGYVKFTFGDTPAILVRYAGALAAFSASCTHMGCPVSGRELEAKGLLVCPCHGSTYDPVTGDRLSGPAPHPLPQINIDVRGDEIYAIPGEGGGPWE